MTAPTTTEPVPQINTAISAEPAAEQGPPDLREAVHTAQLWVADLLGAVGPDRLAGRTPCADFDVETLVRHLFGVADRLVAMGGGRPAESVPPSIPALPDDVVGE